MSDGTGEKQDGREHIHRTTDYLIQKGGLPPKLAHEQAREARLRAEQRETGRRK